MTLCAALCALAVPLAMAEPAFGLGYAQSKVVSANPVDYTPHALNGRVLAIAPVGNTVYVGGSFTSVRNAGSTTTIARNYIFAFDRTTGAVLPFAPALNGAVESIAAAPDGSSIIVGGRFTTVQGVSQRSLTMLTADGGRVGTFAAKTNGYVRKVLVRGNRLIAGGQFSTANGTSRANLAAFNATTGALDTAFNLGVTEGRTKDDGTVTRPSVYEMDADATGSRLVVVGNFRRVAGQVRMQIAVINLAQNALSGWYTQRYANDNGGALDFQCYDVFDTAMRDVEFSADGRFFVVVTTGGAGNKNVADLCDTAARWETPPDVGVGPAQETWFNCTGGDTLLSVAVTASSDPTTGGAVYVGGHQRWLDNCGGTDFAVAGSFAANGIGAINAATGKAIREWNPGRTRGVGAEELVAQAEGLYIGSDTDRLAGEYHARLGLFPLN
jgi:hypothetical protein